jgi:hypothetical protein
MSNEQDKFNHSKRLLKEEAAIAKQLKIAKEFGIDYYISQPHRLAKHHALDCGNSKCLMCSREKIFKERTIQERKITQREHYSLDLEPEE